MEKNKVLHRYLSNDSKFAGVQTILRYEDNGKIILILTTYDASTGTVKRTGSGWIMIIDPRNEKPFFWFELRRTRFFIERVIEVTKLFISIVHHWPKCPECDVDLQLVQVRGFMHMRAFTCLNKMLRHRKVKPHFLITAMPLPEEDHHMLKDRFDQYYMYRQNEMEAGHERDYARLIRSRRKDEKSSLVVTEDHYGDNKHDTKKGETYFYNDERQNEDFTHAQ